MEPSAYEIHELRCKFFEKLENEHGSNKAYFNQADLTRVSNSDHWLKRFLIHHDMEMKDALSMLWDTCEWRKENKVQENACSSRVVCWVELTQDLSSVRVAASKLLSMVLCNETEMLASSPVHIQTWSIPNDYNSDINENTVNREYLEEGSIFVRNRDKDGKSLLILKCKKHVKGQKDFEELKKVVIYWFERAERKDKGEPITLFFDMAETGLNNMDMDYTKYLINLFKHYYPHFLNYILIFEMPWILNAAFKIIKGWLPTKAVQKIKFVSKNSLKDFVDADQALQCWGGLDDYSFKFVPEILDTPTVRLDDYKKKVHFADGSPLVEIAPSFSDIEQENPSPSASKLKISPSESVLFSQEGGELTGNVNLLNINDKTITYKIKTTSPEKYRVRPSCGVLHPNNSTMISVVLQSGHSPGSILRDKFLVMSFLLEENLTSPTELAELWKAADTKIVDQHRLRCLLSGQTTSASQNGAVCSSLPHGGVGDYDQKINQIAMGLNHLTHCNNQLEADLRLSNRLHLVSLVVLLLMGGALLYIIQKLPRVSETSRVSFYEPIPPPTGNHEDL